MVKVLVMEVQEMLRSNVSSICHLAGRGNVEEQGWNGSQGADRRRQEGWNMEGEEETDRQHAFSLPSGPLPLVDAPAQGLPAALSDLTTSVTAEPVATGT